MNRDWIAGMDAMQRVAAPNSDCIALVNSGLAPAWYAKTPLHFCNHNLFRLDKNGNVMWQVKRFDCGKSNWRQLFRRLKQEGGAAAESAVRQPFGAAGSIPCALKTWLPTI
jgi:hypothetical protein